MFAWKQQSFKECVTAHWSSDRARKNDRTSNFVPKLWDRKIGRRAFQHLRRWVVRPAGEAGKENVGISNDKIGEKPIRHKPKGS
jgi:hypothetical protein